MTVALSKVMTYAAMPAIAVMVGSLASLIREPSARLRGAVQHFAAGTVFSVLAVELLPDLMHRHLPWPTFIGFTLGVALMLGLKWFGDHSEGAAGDRSACGMLTAMGIDATLDGALIGLSFAAREVGTASHRRPSLGDAFPWRSVRNFSAQCRTDYTPDRRYCRSARCGSAVRSQRGSSGPDLRKSYLYRRTSCLRRCSTPLLGDGGIVGRGARGTGKTGEDCYVFPRFQSFVNDRYAGLSRTNIVATLWMHF